MIDHQERVKGVIKDHLKTRAMGVPYGFTITPVIAPMPDPATGQPTGQFGPAWDFRLTVQSRTPLIGQDQEDIVAYIIIPGVLPPDRIFKAFAEKAMNDCLEKRAEESGLITSAR